MSKSLVENLLVTALSMLIGHFKDDWHDILQKVATRLNDKIEGTATQLDDIAKNEFVSAVEMYFLPPLKVDTSGGASST